MFHLQSFKIQQNIDTLNLKTKRATFLRVASLVTKQKSKVLLLMLGDYSTSPLFKQFRQWPQPPLR